jgi:prepilin-type N-terminal cleavage/methylation domain-containing protein
MRYRRGFTLVEILVSLVVMVIVTGAIYKMLTSSQRLSRAQAERVSLQSNVRSGALIVPAELRELNTVLGNVANTDVLIALPSDLTYRAMRGIGFVCQTPTATEIRVARGSYSAYRDPAATRDGVYIFIDGNPDVATDDVWLPLGVTAVATASTCGGTSAIALTVTPSTTALTAVPVGTPVRIYETMQLQLYSTGGKNWLGARSVSAGEISPQPVLGPLTANGLAFEYLDAGGAATTDPTAIKSIRVTIRGVTDQNINLGDGSSGTLASVQDSLVTQVVLRNAFRP